jgi:hypothetical protein
VAWDLHRKRGKSGEKGVKLKGAEFCSNVPWLFQVETLLIVGKRGVLRNLRRRDRVVST